MRVLVACEFSGAVRDAFRRLGHEAWSADLEGVEPEGQWPNYHLEGDCRLWLDGSRGPCKEWDLLIAHPPCTYLANSGVKWMYRGGSTEGGRDPERMKACYEAAGFFADLWRAPIARKAIENPIMHGYGQSFVAKHVSGSGMAMLGRKFPPTQIVQPWMFGCGETKATCLWLAGVEPLTPTNIVDGRHARIHRMPAGVNRTKERSRTYAGIAQAMAEQWGGQ